MDDDNGTVTTAERRNATPRITVDRLVLERVYIVLSAVSGLAMTEESKDQLDDVLALLEEVLA